MLYNSGFYIFIYIYIYFDIRTVDAVVMLYSLRLHIDNIQLMLL